jgi:general secretion pathway protein J
MKSQKGFTLIEVMVALLVLSILGVVLAIGVQQMAQWQQRLLDDMDEGNAQLRLQAMIMNDLLQAAPRSVTDAYGGQLPACQSLPEGGFECSRFDVSAGGAGVIRIGYQVDNEGLWRIRWPTVDRVSGATPNRQLLFAKADSLEVRWQDMQDVWQLQWPPAGTMTNTTLPKQIEMIVRVKQKEVLNMWFPISEQVQQ